MTVNGIHPVQAYTTAWKNGSKAKKAAMVVGTAAALGAVGVAVAAGIKGKAPEGSKGIAKIAGKFKDGFSQVLEALKGVPAAIKAKLPAKAEKVADAAEEVVEKAAE